MSAQEVRLPQGTQARLADYQRLVRQVKLAEAFFAGLFGLALSWIVVFGSDRFVDTSSWVRGAILVCGSLGFAVFFPLKCHRWIWGTRTMKQVARLLVHRYPALGDQILGVVELAEGERSPGASLQLTMAAVNQVDESVRDRDLSDAVPHPRSRHWAVAALLPVCLLLLCIGLVPSAAWNAVGRWAMPWRDIDRYTFAQIEQLPEQLVVPHGEEFALQARLRDSTEWSPDSGHVLLSGQSDVNAERQLSNYEFQVPGQLQDGEMYVRIGDVRETVDVLPRSRPELSSLTARIHLPDYLQYSQPQEHDVRGGALTVLAGATMDLKAEVSRPLQSATLSGQSVETDGQWILASGQSIADSETLEFAWIDELGLEAHDPFPLKIRAVEDAAPQVNCVQNEATRVVLNTDVITFAVSAADDFGLKRVGLEWSGLEHPVLNPAPESGEKVVLAGGPEQRSLSTQATFCAESDHVVPQSLRIRAWVEDYLPDRPRAWSAAVVLHVLSPEDHAVWINQQLRRWVSRTDDVYEQEMRLHDENRMLRRMSAEERNTEENQQRLRQQVAAERANAGRLSRVTDQGDDLIRQAIRNPQMLPGHLETFAQALKRLRAIADNRMPSVADLLGDAARSKKTPRPGSASAAQAKSRPSAGNNRSSQPGSPGSGTPAEQKNTPAKPALVDVESGFNPVTEAQPAEGKKKAGSGGLGLPVTQLQGGPQPKKRPGASDSSAMDEAVDEQADLLADFEKIREDLQKIMDDLDNSTFVKRLKSASRRQLDLAAELNRTLFDGFGVSSPQLQERQLESGERIAAREESESQTVWLIKSDLEAYFSRRQDPKYQRIAEEMAEMEVVSRLGMLGPRVRNNQTGDAIARVEFWADTLDRWAEELVSPSRCGKCKGCKGDSLPPEIVLEIMRILEEEIDLREETRAAEQAVEAVSVEEHEEQAAGLCETQADLQFRTLNVVADIRAIPDGSRRFAKAIGIIEAAGAAMQDAVILLSAAETGPETIAAETEAIELLLQSKRCQGSGGGGGGASPGGGGEGDTETAALALHGPGSDPNAHIEAREVRQATGATVSRLPAEYREGLEAFFQAVETTN